jgi:E3 ubiquitin-protein ligase RAD18
MKEALINSHLDKCIQGNSYTPVDDQVSSSSPAPPDSVQIAPPGTIAYSQKKPSKQNERLPYINYSLFTDTKLRQKLRELGIPNHGSKDLMRRRHTEWVNLWNANCDSTQPVSKRDLLRELKVWEDTLGRQLERPTANTGFMAKEFDRDRHIRHQKGNFDDLIQQARERAKASSQKPEEKNVPSGVESVTPKTVADMEVEDLEIRTHQALSRAETNAATSLMTTANPSGEQPTSDISKDLPNGHGSDMAINIPSSPLLSEAAAPQATAQDASNANSATPSKKFFV